jgi:TonB family protein
MNKILPLFLLTGLLLTTQTLRAHLDKLESVYLDSKRQIVASSANATHMRELFFNTETTGYYVEVVSVKQNTDTLYWGNYFDKALTIENGHFKYFYFNGRSESEGDFKMGSKVGTWKRWTFDGVERPDRFYSDEKFTTGLGRPTNAAAFPGGLDSLQNYVNTNLNYPSEARNRGIEGTVYVAFTIDKSGVVRYPEVSTSVHYLLDEEAIRFVAEMPEWKPASKNGNYVDTSCVIPITFDLETTPDTGGAKTSSPIEKQNKK